MSRLDDLPPDQRAALSLLLRQRKSYADVATLLGISELAVHDRAHAALAMLAPRRARELSSEQRLEVGDYLLSQQPGVAERLRTRTFLCASEPARSWAAEVAAQLAQLAGVHLPEIPPPTPSAAAPAPAAKPAPQRVGDLSSAPAASAHPAASAQDSDAPTLPSSRVGGALLIGVIVAAVVVGVVLLTGGSGSSKPGAGVSAAVKTSSTATKTGPTIDDQIKLTPTLHGSHTTGVVYVLSEGSKRAFFIQVQHVPATKGFYYAVWLYNSRTSELPLSKSPAVGSSHSFAGGSSLPSNSGEYHEILLTRETNAHPTHPGPVVLRGPFSLH
jgi:nucleoid-associated protein YgaU